MPEMERLSREFFDRPATDVAPDLLGCVLWHASPAGLVMARLVEVEAYRGPIDPASHAFRGPTARNGVMFGPPGRAYVYFSYGMHYCVNLVCQPAGLGEAVLIRAGAVVFGAGLAARRRYGPEATDVASQRRQRERDLARGPGRLCQALGIDRSLDGADACAPGGPLGISPPHVRKPAETAGTGLAQAARAATAADAARQLAGGGALESPEAAAARVIRTGPRVGISRAADRPWRFWLADDGHVSVYKSLKPRDPRPKPVSGSAIQDGTISG